MTGHPVPTSHRTRHLGLPDSWEGGSAGFICPSACLRYSPIRHRLNRTATKTGGLAAGAGGAVLGNIGGRLRGK